MVWVERNKEKKWKFLTWEYDLLALHWVKILTFQIPVELNLFSFCFNFNFLSPKTRLAQGITFRGHFSLIIIVLVNGIICGQQCSANRQLTRVLAYDWLVLNTRFSYMKQVFLFSQFLVVFSKVKIRKWEGIYKRKCKYKEEQKFLPSILKWENKIHC